MNEDLVKAKIYSVVALTIGLLSFFQLLGIEKGILAIILGVLALKRVTKDTVLRVKVLSWLGIILAVFYITFIIGIFSRNPQLIDAIKANIGSIQNTIK